MTTGNKSPGAHAAGSSQDALPVVAWKCGNEYAPYHPQASHINPDHRDGWNACYRAAQASLLAKEAEIAALKEREGTIKDSLIVADAERYRWLRDPERGDARGRAPYVGIENDDDYPNRWALFDSEADAAIDAARAAADQGGA